MSLIESPAAEVAFRISKSDAGPTPGDCSRAIQNFASLKRSPPSERAELAGGYLDLQRFARAGGLQAGNAFPVGDPPEAQA